MDRSEFGRLLAERIVFFDGATGTELQKAGMPNGVCPEKWILDNPEALIRLQSSYVEAGTDILLAPTFTANRIKLAEYGLEASLKEINKKLVALSKEACGGKALVAGDMTMTGRALYPMGDMSFDELVDIYREQAAALLDAGVDLYIVETMMSLQETRAAVIAIREVTGELPVLASMTFEPGGKSLYGTTPDAAAVVLASLGADAVGMNCSTGPSDMLGNLEVMKRASFVPVFAKPNAGMPKLVSGATVYDMEESVFADFGEKLVMAGANIIGGCCGTTPGHIKALHERTAGLRVPEVRKKYPVVSSGKRVCEISLDAPFKVVGERINPTGKKKLQESLRAGSMDMVIEFARAQERDGASILDVNMGTNGIDEKAMMLTAIEEIGYVTELPLCLDSSDPKVLAEALKAYEGRALLNSISLERVKIEELLPIAKKYGAMFVLLPLNDKGLPKDLEEKHAMVREIIDRALSLGFTKEDIVADALVATVGANPLAGRECLSTIKYCHDELKIATICGLSNISFGLPERSIVNTAFLTMAMECGLTMAIANPMQDELMNAMAAADLLMARDGSDMRYIERAGRWKEKREEKEAREAAARATSSEGKEEAGTGGLREEAGAGGLREKAGAGGLRDEAGAGGLREEAGAGGLREKAGTGGLREEAGAVFKAVMEGARGRILEITKAELASGRSADEILNEQLIPAINKVGELFEKKKYFLPQLIASADAMQVSISHLSPLLSKGDAGGEKKRIVFATVEGDIHDIGKNLVVLMLQNYGYEVHDLGKDVPAERIVDTAIEEGAVLIGLSALMTTTMMRMKDVVELAKEKGYAGKIIVGGAAVTESFAKEIGADGYSGDAAECVRLVGKMVG